VRGHQGAIEVPLPVVPVLAIVLAERVVPGAGAGCGAGRSPRRPQLGHTVRAFRVGQHPGAVGRGIVNTSPLFLCGGPPPFLAARWLAAAARCGG
jgi:hypothetical protein